MAYKVKSPKIKAYSNSWTKTTPDEYYNPKTNTKIEIFPYASSYKVSVVNLTTKTSQGLYFTGLTREKGHEIAKRYIETGELKP